MQIYLMIYILSNIAKPLLLNVLMGKNFSHAPKSLTTLLVNVFLKIHVAGWQRRLSGLNSDEKLLFRERNLETSKFIISSSYKLSIIRHILSWLLCQS